MRTVLIPIIAGFLLISACDQKPVQAFSPDGRISVSLGFSGDGAFAYGISLDEQVLIRPSAIVLKFQAQNDFGGELQMELLSECKR